MVRKGWLIASFTILVLTVTWLGWSIQQSIEHTQEIVCIQFDVEFDLLTALLLASDHVPEQEAVEILEDAAQRLAASCS